MDETEACNVIEAALFAAGRPLSVDELCRLFPEDQQPERALVEALLERLSGEYATRGIELAQFEHGYRFQTRACYAEWVNRLFEERPPRYSRALLETLAIIAYRQPVTRGEIEDIRGVAVSSETIKVLLTRQWIRQVGAKEVPGRPALYGTTRQFLEYFNLQSLDELPALLAAESGHQMVMEAATDLVVEGGAPAAGLSDDTVNAQDEGAPGGSG